MAPTSLRTPAHDRLLALETSTDQLSVAVGAGGDGGPPAVYTGPGAAQSSMHLLPSVQRLLREKGWTLGTLDAIVVARGPGSFTGLRTACAVAQGLAYGAQGASPEVAAQGGLPVLPVEVGGFNVGDLDQDGQIGFVEFRDSLDPFPHPRFHHHLRGDAVGQGAGHDAE